MDKEMANRFTELRKQQGLSQEQLAEKLGVSRQAVSKWERAEASPDIENLSALARLYGITIDELINGPQQPFPENDSEAYADKRENSEQPNEPDPSEISENKGSSGITFLLHGFPFAMIVLMVYFLTGFLLDAWYINWVLFLLIPCWYGLVTAIRTRRPALFPYPVLIAAVYLVLGFWRDLWHPGWIVFFTIPIYYWVADAAGRSGR